MYEWSGLARWERWENKSVLSISFIFVQPDDCEYTYNFSLLKCLFSLFVHILHMYIYTYTYNMYMYIYINIHIDR